MNEKDIVVVASARTAFDRFGGVTKNIPSVDLASWTIAEIVRRSGLPPEAIDEVNLGQCVLMEAGTQTDIVGRQALIRAGLREETISTNLTAPAAHPPLLCSNPGKT
jgi:acetyl-CoA C-acetyltransferase